MTDYTLLYNKMIHDLEMERYWDGYQKAEFLNRHYPLSNKVNYARALLCSYFGYYTEAYQSIKRVSDEQDQAEIRNFIDDHKEEVANIQGVYNRALDKCSNSLHQQSIDELEAVVRESRVTVPIECYCLLVLVYLRNHDYTVASNLVEIIPKRFHIHPDYVTLERLCDFPLTSKNIQRNRLNRAQYSRWASVSIMVISLFSMLYLLSSNQDLKSANSQNIERTVLLTEEIEQLNEDREKSIEEMKPLESENELLSGRVSDLQKQVEQQTSLIDKAGYSMNQLKAVASYQEYRKGLLAFNNANHTDSIQHFQDSISMDTSYYSDDAMYFLIRALVEEEQHPIDIINEFLQRDDEAFIHSPYIDDVLLIHGKSYLEKGEESQALFYLDRLIEDYSNEWTAERARHLMDRRSVNE